MRSMAIDRRRLLLGAALAPFAGAPAQANAALFAAACATAGGGHALCAFAADGRIAWTTPLPGRGHGLARRGRLLAALSRRPGAWLLLVDARSGRVRARAEPPDGFALNGHGAFAEDGGRLFATATRAEDDSGWLIAFDGAAGWRPAAAWPTGGSDPHELLRLGDALVVANGGLPDGRTPADVADVDTSLAWLDARDGTILGLRRPPAELRRVSLRHMAALGRRIFVGGQDQGPRGEAPPLLATSDGSGLRYLPTPPLSGYCGGVAARDGAVCLTSPHAGRAVTLAGDDGRPLGARALDDVCGVAAAAGGFLLTGGRGELASTASSVVAPTPGRRWDNHAAPLAV